MVLTAAILIVVFVPMSTSWAVAVLVLGCAAEAVEIVVLRRWSRRLDRRLPPSRDPTAMIGETGTAVSACRPDGQVQVRGELWSASCRNGVDAGDSVRVDDVEDGLVLVVSPAAHPQLPEPSADGSGREAWTA